MAAHATAFFRRIDDAIQFTDGYAQTVVRDFGPEVIRWIESVSAVKKARATTGSQPAKTKPRRAALGASPPIGTDTEAEPSANPSPPPSHLQLQGYNCIEFVLPGTRFYLEFSVEDAQMARGGLGPFLHALRDFILQQNLGGWTKNGFGRFEVGQMTIRQRGSDAVEQSLFG